MQRSRCVLTLRIQDAGQVVGAARQDVENQDSVDMAKPRVFEQLRTTLQSMNSMRPQGNPLAVDFGVSALRVLRVSSGDPASIQSAAQLKTPDDLLDNPAKRILFQFDALPKLVKSGLLCGGFQSLLSMPDDAPASMPGASAGGA